MRRFSAVSLFLGLFFFAATIYAQTTATITGVVTDPTGAVIPNVTVVLLNPSTGVSFKAVTNSAGSYRIANIPPGPGYQLVFTQQGFSPYHVDNVYVNVANTDTENAQLAPGQQVEITVNAGEQSATLNTEDASIGNNVQVSKLNELPVQNRLSPTALLTLEPGITLSGATTGARVDQNNITVDGLDVNDFGTGNFGSITANAPVDSVQEFRGTVGGYTASSGQGGGGQFQMVTKSGSNQWHGQANLYHRDNSTTANDWFNDLAGLRAPKLVQNQFGGSLGGPIKHDKAFFFFDYYNSRIARSAAALRTVPLASYTSGNVSYINNNPGCTFRSRQNTTPNCISSLTSAQVQAMDPAGKGESPAFYSLLKLYPAANDVTAGDGINTGGFRFNAPQPQYITTYVGKINYNLTEKISLWGRGTFSRENQVFHQLRSL